MSSPAVFAEVSRTLRELILAGVQGDPVLSPLGVSVDHNDPKTPPATGGANRISVWLYQVAADEFTRNQPGRAGLGGADGAPRVRTVAPPLPLNLGYLVTPLVGTPDQDVRALGVAMRALHDSAVVRLVVPAAGVAEELRIGLASDPLDDRTKLWEALGDKYRLSVCYLVRTVRLDSQRVAAAPPVAEVTAELGETVEGGG